MSPGACNPADPTGAVSLPCPGLSIAGPNAVVAWAPAKVNLFFEVLGKRPDGYHAVETLMVAVDLFDTLECRDDPTGRLTLTCDTPGVPAGPGNLVHEAAERLRTRYAPGRGAAIRLTKRVPHQAGLGGGSSDAATTLRALDRLWGLARPLADLVDLAAGLGSDVPFFLAPPAGWCTGRGQEVAPEPVGQRVDMVIVKPHTGLATADVYRRVAVPAVPVNGSPARAALRAGDIEALGRSLHNRLQEPAFAVAPPVEQVYRRLTALDPLGCRMSGSGSAVFALCRDRREAVRTAERFRTSTPPGEPASQVFVVRSWP
jgi:4-diphosphocytidyl-2-C-methyl-D-erythritol kinase